MVVVVGNIMNWGISPCFLLIKGFILHRNIVVKENVIDVLTEDFIQS